MTTISFKTTLAKKALLSATILMGSTAIPAFAQAAPDAGAEVPQAAAEAELLRQAIERKRQDQERQDGAAVGALKAAARAASRKARERTPAVPSPA